MSADEREVPTTAQDVLTPCPYCNDSGEVAQEGVLCPCPAGAALHDSIQRARLVVPAGYGIPERYSGDLLAFYLDCKDHPERTHW